MQTYPSSSTISNHHFSHLRQPLLPPMTTNVIHHHHPTFLAAGDPRGSSHNHHFSLLNPVSCAQRNLIVLPAGPPAVGITPAETPQQFPTPFPESIPAGLATGGRGTGWDCAYMEIEARGSETLPAGCGTGGRPPRLGVPELENLLFTLPYKYLLYLVFEQAFSHVF